MDKATNPVETRRLVGIVDTPLTVVKFSFFVETDVTGTFTSGGTAVAGCTGGLEILTSKKGAKGVGLSIFFTREGSEVRKLRSTGATTSYDWFEAVLPDTMQALYIQLLLQGRVKVAAASSGLGFVLVG